MTIIDINIIKCYSEAMNCIVVELIADMVIYALKGAMMNQVERN